MVNIDFREFLGDKQWNWKDCDYIPRKDDKIAFDYETYNIKSITWTSPTNLMIIIEKI